MRIAELEEFKAYVQSVESALLKSVNEVDENFRAHSARLRAVEKISTFFPTLAPHHRSNFALKL